MIRLLIFALAISYFLLAACQKHSREELHPSPPVNIDQIQLVNEEIQLEKSSESSFELEFELQTGDASGNIAMMVDETYHIIESSMDESLYEELRGRMSDRDLFQLPMVVAHSVRKFHFGDADFRRKFIFPMSKREFDRRMSKCEGNASSLAILLCAGRTIIEAIGDCISAQGDDVQIHCW